MKRIAPFALAAMFVLPGAAQAADGGCAWTADQSAFKVTWTAFKTPKKVGVNGSFKKVTATGAGTGATVPAVMEGAAVSIDPASVDTKNPSRDMTIAGAFFGKFDVEKIEAKVVSVKGNDEEGWITLAIDMNGVEREVPLAYKVVDGLLTAEGTVDVLDYSLAGALETLGHACEPLHKGKTWPDVTIGFSVPLTCN